MHYKHAFWGEISEIEAFMYLFVLRSPESENNIFSVWSVCVCVCISVIIITQKQITAET